MMAKYDLKFPVFTFGDGEDDNRIYVDENIKSNTSTVMSVLKNNYYNDKQVIDSNGNVYTIEKAILVKYNGFLGYIPILSGGRRIIIDFEYKSKVEKISLDEFKNIVISKVKKAPDFREELYGNIDRLIRLIDTASSFEEIAEVLGY